MATTPMMQQYYEIKANYKDYILFYRLGDFYEMFHDDAKLASKELDLTLTGKDCGETERAAMCGIPYHSVEGYIGKLVSKGYKVAICEQLEDAAFAKGIVKRDVVRIITPGTVIEANLLNESKNNYLCSICVFESEVSVSFSDISTGQISATKFTGKNYLQRLVNEIGIYSPSEVIINIPKTDLPQVTEFLQDKLHAIINDNQNIRFDRIKTEEIVKRQFAILPIEFTPENIVIICSVGALLDYISETQKTDISYIKNINIYEDGKYLEIDINTRRNLEICETMRTKEKKGSLLWVLDKTRTAMGARLIRKWVELPLINTYYISRRQKAVAELYNNFMNREELSDLLKQVLDLERLITKIVYGTANGKDLKAISSTLSVIPKVKQILSTFKSEEFVEIYSNLDEIEDMNALIEKSITDDPPFSIREGGFIRDGYNEEVDKLREIMTNGKSWVEKIELSEREASGIRTLKIGYNRVFGYYIEVTKSNINDVPQRYIRKQTLSNCERYITQELKDMEATILGAADKISTLEYDLFQQIRETLADNVSRIQITAIQLALTDVYLSLADVAIKNNYICPEVEYSDIIEIKDGRHPIVELFVKDSYFVPNDTLLDTKNSKLWLITGPNMAGKSTYMRQVALITIMAQIGSYVPAKEARVGVVDKIFTRVGASDDLASGQSTFMLEMTEVAYILKNATSRSLIIYDEIGRGTSTFDGMSIAKAIAEYTASKEIGAKTLFATHYHELIELENEIHGIVNYSIAAKKKGDDITFLRKIVKGAADDSYGIEVAKLAGVPNEIIKRAKEVLKHLEEHDNLSVSTPKPKLQSKLEENVSFDDYRIDDVTQKIKNLDINTLTPIEAINFIYEIKKILN